MTTSAHLWTPEEVAAYLQIPLATLYAWRYRQEGPPSIKVGRHLRYRARDVDRWLDAQSSAANEDSSSTNRSGR